MRFARRYTAFGVHTMELWVSFVVVDSRVALDCADSHLYLVFTYALHLIASERMFVFDQLAFGGDDKLAGIVHCFPPVRTRHAMVFFPTMIGRVGRVVRLRSLANFQSEI